MYDAISLNTPDGRSILLQASKIVGIYPSRPGSVVAVEPDRGREWTEIVVGDSSDVVFQKWEEAKPVGVCCLEDWLASN
jgi:hypothetical protein